MAIVKYKLVASSGEMITPNYVHDGGYWWDLSQSYPNDSEYIGYVKDGVEFPDDLTTYTLSELQARQREIHSRHPMRVGGKPDDAEMTDEQVNATIEDWVDARS
tara:strand:+ start:1169 stop:1480 length:312 start_codon:yes stop_codon:yes gene_type:complete